jgi:nicotinate-nucleotide pyrophosphorylase (carboxylating)
MNSLPDLDQAIDQWLMEDIGKGDHSTLGTIPPGTGGSAVLHAKQSGIIAGISAAGRVFQRFDPETVLVPWMNDGEPVSSGDRVFRINGKARTILQCERLVLNIMQRMSGIATSTSEYARLLEGTKTKILDTRKTTPGFRLLEKEAVRLGGGMNHRFGLYDMVLIKDNHIDFAGGIEPAIKRILNYLKERGFPLQIEVETRSLGDVEEVLRCGGIHRIMLDNFTIGQTGEAVKLINGRFQTESSGRINLENIREYADCGVDFISVGALTHHVESLDLSLKASFSSSSKN